MTALTIRSLQPCQAGLSKRSLAHTQDTRRFRANSPGSHFPLWRHGSEQDSGTHVLFVDVRKLKRPPALAGRTAKKCSVRSVQWRV